MPTTPGGTAYSTTSTDLGPHGVCVWTVANAKINTPNLPAILYAHGAGGASDQMVSLPAWNSMRNWLIDQGFVIIEGSGGANYGTQNWGGPEARLAYPAYLAYVETILSVGKVVLLGRSMGGLVTAWLASQYSGKDRFSGWINNSGVSTLFYGNSSGAKDTAASSAWYFSPTVWQPYGATSMASMSIAAAGHAPEEWEPSSWAGVKVLSLWGTADSTVPASVRGASYLRSKWGSNPAIDKIHIRVGGDHTGTNGSYLDVGPMVSFIQEVLGLSPTPVDQALLYREKLRYTLLGGVRRIIKPRPM